ncbi:hypothetical protein IAQ67_28510 (plasmid) [Paenibacillus peoriae]|uniref:Uncharacterized protein n=1 Tax=Paenibacillus peoriae TaxID=59893 RepID=A0A7H0YH98_9BACL|nr:hypothetical protein [Paenibacillus peoriae]QNR70456.1 hypothetical protein IAQ67_28510 [Paenibacillus peoriae]
MNKAYGVIPIPEEYIPQLLDLPNEVTVRSIDLSPLTRTLSIIIESDEPIEGLTFEQLAVGSSFLYSDVRFVSTTTKKLKVGRHN